MANYIVIDSELSSIADAIREKAGTNESLKFPNGFVNTIENISSGPNIEIEALSITQNGTYTAPTGKAYSPVNVNVQNEPVSVPSKDVNFIDYDGTIVYSYTAAEFAELSAMPSNPNHSNDEISLISQGWNWSFADAQAYVAKYGKLEVGQMYVTADGKTHIKIYIDPNTPANRMTFYLRWTQSVSHGVTVDWGDGSATQTYSDTSVANHDHTYTVGGWYDITLAVTSGTMNFEGSNGTSKYFIGGSLDDSNSYSRIRIREVRLGRGLVNNALSYAFLYCYALAFITIPNGVTSIGNNAFSSCYALAFITIPNSVTSIGDNVFNLCQNMRHIAIPNSVTSIGSSAFSACYNLKDITLPDSIESIGTSALRSLYVQNAIILPANLTSINNSLIQVGICVTSVTIPSKVTSIGSYAFSALYSASEYHLMPTTPPALANANAFTSIPDDCIIYVPRGSLNAYKSATNWSTLASYMQEEPQ